LRTRGDRPRLCAARPHGVRRRRDDRLCARCLVRRPRNRTSLPVAQDLMARKLPQLQRALDAPALASVAYGEIASSIYFALGIIALHALGFAPLVLGLVGLLFLVVALSYAEGTASIRETGGAATFVRVAFNDLAGFLTGWVLFLDYLIVIALSALFVPHYLGLALGIDAIARRPGDVIAACVVVASLAAVRLLRRTRLSAAQSVRRDHVGCRDLRSDRDRRLVGVSLQQRNDRARNELVACAADGGRRRAPAASPTLVRADPARLRRPDGCARAARGDD